MPQSKIGFGVANRSQKGANNENIVPPSKEWSLMERNFPKFR